MIPKREYGTVVPMARPEEFPRQLENALRAAIQSHWDRTAIAAWGHARTWTTVAAEALAQLEIAAAR
jgi:hypothetical protein